MWKVLSKLLNEERCCEFLYPLILRKENVGQSTKNEFVLLKLTRYILHRTHLKKNRKKFFCSKYIAG